VTQIDVTIGAELPDWTFHWLDTSGNTIDFSTGHAFTLRVGNAGSGVMAKTTGIAGADTNPNVTISFAVDEWANVPPGLYSAELWARRTVDDRDREPLRFTVRVLQTIPAPAP
jgi:hypothetical protein